MREGEEIVTSILLSMCKTNFSLHKNFFANAISETVQIFVTRVVSKFHDDLTVNESGIIVLLG